MMKEGLHYIYATTRLISYVTSQQTPETAPKMHFLLTIFFIFQTIDDLQTNNGTSGDAFVVQMEPLAGAIPVHFCPGNHEDANDFSQYRARFNLMPGGAEVRKAQSIFHSFNVGLVHVIMFSSEVFFTVGEYSLLLLPEQFAYVEADLKAVDRNVTPWIITMAHQVSLLHQFCINLLCL